ncbi:MAG: hypothetical protein HY302_10425 [Opitutae bacterium]|nr:hypothetical protein [Opitutae bacterium]
MIGWLADFFRFWWGLFYWNTRKSVFRRRGAGTARCPCQNYSDSGRALETRCDAALMWNEPGRFRRVCPLLVSTPDGWRCSVNTADVRPFWPRAWRYAGLAVFCLYLAGAVGAFGVLRSLGYRISPLAVIVPTKWPEIRAAREGVYAAHALRALNAGNYQSAVLALELVCDLNRHNVAAGLTLAGLWQASNQWNLADGLYVRLMAENPGQQLAVAQAWYHSLLSRADYAQIKELAVRLLPLDEAHRGVWLHALFFAVRQTHDAHFLNELLARPPAVPDWCMQLIRIEAALLQGRLASVERQLTSPDAAPASPYVPYYQIDRLIASGRYDDAIAMLDAYGPRLSPDEATFHRLRIYAARGWTSLAEIEFDDVLSRPLTPRQITLICAQLVRQPNRTLLSRYFVRFVRARLPLTTENYPLFSATFCAAAVNGNWERAADLASMLRQLTGTEAQSFQALQEFLRRGGAAKRIDLVLPAIALPIEVTYALLERYPPSA